MTQLMHRDMPRFHAGVPGRMTVLHLWLQVSVRNSRTTKDFVIRQYPKCFPMFLVKPPALGKLPSLSLGEKVGKVMVQISEILRSVCQTKAESMGSMWTPQQVSRHGVGP